MTKKDIRTKKSEPDKVDAFMETVEHPLKNVMILLREIILNAGPEIGEEIKWNAPAFFYSGEMEPSDPKEYKRHLAVFNFFKKDAIRIVFPSGAKVTNSSGLLEGDYPDGRRIATFFSIDDVKEKEAALKSVIVEWLTLLEK
jgi:hypothetical protein